jgi:uncharacterized protein YuzB (UPF0349 family)
MRKAVLVLILMISIVGCDRCNRNQLLPEVSFAFTINVNEPAYFDLSVATGFLYFDGGTVKLILYRINQEEFNVYDARSTYNPDDPCICVVEDNHVFIEDPCGDSKWLLTDGTIVSGSAAQNLLQYNYTFDSATGVLYFYN